MSEPARLLLGVSGSIHATELPRYLRQFRVELNAEVTVIMTAAAQRIIPAGTVAAYSGGAVHTDLWEAGAGPGQHVGLPQWADLFVVLPATANTLASAAHGIADNLLSTTVLASERPVVFAPAMNSVMYGSRAVQRNLATLRCDGHLLIPARETLAVATGNAAGGMGPHPAAVAPFLREVLRTRAGDG